MDRVEQGGTARMIKVDDDATSSDDEDEELIAEELARQGLSYAGRGVEGLSYAGRGHGSMSSAGPILVHEDMDPRHDQPRQVLTAEQYHMPHHQPQLHHPRTPAQALNTPAHQVTPASQVMGEQVRSACMPTAGVLVWQRPQPQGAACQRTDSHV